MPHSRYRVFVSICVLGFVLSGFQACQQSYVSNCGFLMASESSRVSWQGSSLPIQLYWGSHFPDDPSTRGAVQRAISSWNHVGLFFKEDLWENPSSLDCTYRDGRSTIHWVTDWKACLPGARANEQGVAITYREGDRLLEVDIYINSAFHTFYYGLEKDIQVSANKRKIDLESLLLHELGHGLGLAHSPILKEVPMSPYLSLGKTRRVVTEQDRKNLSCEYSVHEI